MNSFFPNKYQPSFWDYDVAFPEKTDICIVGAGFTGIGLALGARKKFPNAQIKLIEQLPEGAAASTMNAGFFCFGSPTEIIDTINEIGEDACFKLIEKRWKGSRFLLEACENLGIKLPNYGGYEIFADEESFNKTADNLAEINKQLKGINQALAWETKEESWAKYKNLLFTSAECRVHPAQLYAALEKHLRKLNIDIIKNCKLTNYHQNESDISLTINDMHHLKTKSLLLATNAFQKDLEEVKAARNIVLLYDIQGEIPVKANIHYDKGYVYMREVQGRFLIGGGRNQDPKVESTDSFGTNSKITDYLAERLQSLTTMQVATRPAYSWSGIISSGKSGEPLFKRLEKNVYYAGRYGGMGVTLSLYHGYNSGINLEIE